MTDSEMMAAALEEAKLAAAEGEIPVGAVLVKDGKILARAHNRREALHDPTAHAEMLCLREAARTLGDWRMNGAVMAVTLEPCPMCAGALAMSRLSRCVYGAADPERGCCGSVYDIPADPAFGSPTVWCAGIEAEACAEVLTGFLSGRRQNG